MLTSWNILKGIRMHHVVHSTMLKPFKAREGDYIDIDDGEDELFFDVESVVDSKLSAGRSNIGWLWNPFRTFNASWIWSKLSTAQNLALQKTPQ